MLLRPPAILGAGETSVWNTLRPAGMRDDEAARHAAPDTAFNWVHVDDLAALTADLAAGPRPDRRRPDGGCTPVNVCAGAGTHRDYFETVTRAVGVEPVWTDEPGVDRGDPGDARARLGLDADRRPHPGAGRDRGGAGVSS